MWRNVQGNEKPLPSARVLRVAAFLCVRTGRKEGVAQAGQWKCKSARWAKSELDHLNLVSRKCDRGSAASPVPHSINLPMATTRGTGRIYKI